MKCPNCSTELAGATKCECGYDQVAATTGRPRMDEVMGLPESPLMGRGLNFNMAFGLFMCLGGAALAFMVWKGMLGNIPHPYLIAVGMFAMGVLRYGRGCAQCRSD